MKETQLDMVEAIASCKVSSCRDVPAERLYDWQGKDGFTALFI